MNKLFFQIYQYLHKSAHPLSGPASEPSWFRALNQYQYALFGTGMIQRCSVQGVHPLILASLQNFKKGEVEATKNATLVRHAYVYRVCDPSVLVRQKPRQIDIEINIKVS